MHFNRPPNSCLSDVHLRRLCSLYDITRDKEYVEHAKSEKGEDQRRNDPGNFDRRE